MSATATQEKPKSRGRKDGVPLSRVKLIEGWDANTLAEFIAETPSDDPEFLIAVDALDGLQQRIAGIAGDEEPDEVARLRRLADDKDAEAENIVEDDEEGAQILHVEANGFREEADSKLAAFREEAGEAVGAMPPSEPERFVEPDPETIVVAGVEMEYPDMGGKSPTRATLTLVDPKALLRDGTGFTKGQRIRFSGEAVVNFVGQKDEHDSASGIVAGAEQQHKARIVDLRIEAL